MRASTNNPFKNNYAPGMSLAKKDYPSEVEEIWQLERQLSTAGIPRGAKENGAENWLETEAER